MGLKICSVFSHADLVSHKSVLDNYKKCQMDSICQTVVQPLHGYTLFLLATKFKGENGTQKAQCTNHTHKAIRNLELDKVCLQVKKYN